MFQNEPKPFLYCPPDLASMPSILEEIIEQTEQKAKEVFVKPNAIDTGNRFDVPIPPGFSIACRRYPILASSITAWYDISSDKVVVNQKECEIREEYYLEPNITYQQVYYATNPFREPSGFCSMCDRAKCPGCACGNCRNYSE